MGDVEQRSADASVPLLPPLAPRATRLFGPLGWAALAAIAFVLVVLVPAANLALPVGNPLHVPDQAPTRGQGSR